MPKRKGAVRRADIPANLLRALNAGTEETASLAEGLAVDFALLLHAAAPELSADDLARVAPADGVTRRMRAAGELLADRFGAAGVARFAGHPSDTVRGWAAYTVAALPGPTLGERLALLRPLADDPHFGVREWAWLAVRGEVAADIDAAVAVLTPWTAAESPNLRRFATEVTRPRGVWCAHIARLKANPAVGLPLLEPLRADPAKYVQDSVANWLNDAAKTQPAWVRDLCARWRHESDTPATRRIGARAERGGAAPEESPENLSAPANSVRSRRQGGRGDSPPDARAPISPI